MPDQKADPKTDNDAFLKRLQSLASDRGHNANLRRYWSPATRHQAYPTLGLLGALERRNKALLAALYAAHPDHRPGIGVGRAALSLGDRREGHHPYDSHFRRLLASEELGTLAEPGDLAPQLHRLVRRLAREGRGLDYAQLLKDLNFWKDYRQGVKVRWSKEFWSVPAETPSTEAA
jgi:CRISPR type I-E-associated protein CasB/Cse2